MAAASFLPRVLPRLSRSARALVVAALVLGATTACQATTATDGASPTSTTVAGRELGEPSPALTAPGPTAVLAADAPTDEAVAAAVDLLVASGEEGPGAPEMDRLALSGDLRQAWVLADALRIADEASGARLAQALGTLTGQALPEGESAWVFYGDLLLGWDVPTPPGYLEDKAHLYAAVDGSLAPFFDPAATLDWRTVTWSGAGADAGPALDAPETVAGTDGASWLTDDEVVYGVVVGGEARAYPSRIVAVHEVVNDTVGGRPIVVAHCRICRATVAYDRGVDVTGAMLTVDGTAIELAATGLLERGAPLLFDRASGSVVRSMVGEGVSGRLGAESRALAPLGVRTTTWAAWLAAFPDTTVISDDAGIGRVYVLDPLADQGQPGLPAWPVGPVDDRLAGSTGVLGVTRIGADPVAFPVARAAAALGAGSPVELAGVRVVLDAGGLAAVDAVDGQPLASHEANWLAWSQFHPVSQVWTG